MEIIADREIRKCVVNPEYYLNCRETSIIFSAGPITSSLSTIKCDIIDTDQ